MKTRGSYSIFCLHRYKGFRRMFGGQTPSLKKLTEKVVGVQIQHGEHSSVSSTLNIQEYVVMYFYNSVSLHLIQYSGILFLIYILLTWFLAHRVPCHLCLFCGSIQVFWIQISKGMLVVMTQKCLCYNFFLSGNCSCVSSTDYRYS